MTLANIIGIVVVVSMLGVAVVANLDSAGRFFMQEGSLIESIACYEMMTSIESFLDVHDLRLADAWTDLSLAYSKVPRYKDAIRAQRQAITLRREILGDDDTSALTLTANLASYEALNKDYADAERDLKAILVLEARLGQHEMVSEGFILKTLTDTYIAEKKYQDAENTAEKLILIDDTLIPARQFSYDGREKLAAIYCKTNRLVQAEPLVREALALKEKNFPTDSTSLIYPHEMLARVLVANGRKDEAQKEIDAAIALIEKRYGKSDEHVAYWKARYAQIQQAPDPLTD